MSAPPIEQRCSTQGCHQSVAYKTRTDPAYCLQCIDAAYIEGGLTPLEPFTARKARRRTECLVCHVTLTYPLGYVMDNNAHRIAVCRVCHWKDWGAANRLTLKTELDTLIGAALAQPGRLHPDDQAWIDANEEARRSIERWWWPTERTRAAVDRLHHELLLDTVEHNDGMDPVVVRCRQCGFESVQLPGRMGAELAGRWCMCPSCNSRNKGVCASDVAVGFMAHGMVVGDPKQGPDTVQDARCERCGTPRRVSIRQLNRGLVPCYVCDGAADPSSPHRVYLMRFPKWQAYKVGITNSGNDARLQTHYLNGAELVEIITVPHRGAALWVEAAVLATVAAWPVSGEPVEKRVSGWTEMWDASAPITARLGEYIERAQAIPLDKGLVSDWKTNRDVVPPPTPTPELTLRAGDKVCFTGAGEGRSRKEWQQMARDAGLRAASDVSPGVALLVIPDGAWATAKVRHAKELGIPVAVYEDFVGFVRRL